MATGFEDTGWHYTYLNPDGSWTDSHFKAHEGAACFKNYDFGYLIPVELFGEDL